MTTIQVLNNHHFLFACEVINGLNRFYNIPIVVSPHFEDDNYFNNDIRWAIATISYLFRKDFVKIFTMLDEGLKNKKNFNEYCKLIPVRRNNRYFFNFLRRVSLIYEMAVYCYRDGKNLFLKARNCIADYEHKEYFSSEGSWSGLNKTASFIRELGRPFLLLILEESTLKHPLSFSATVERIESRLKMQNNTVILNSDEMSFLIEQKERFIEREEETQNIDLQVEKEKTFTQSPELTTCVSSMASADEVSITSERKAIMDYLGSFLDPKVLNGLKLPLEITKYESSNVSKPLGPLESRKSRTDTESTREYDYLTTGSASSLGKKLTTDMRFRSNQSMDEQRKVAEGTHGSSNKYKIYRSSPSSRYFPAPSNNRNTKKCKTRKPSKRKIDLSRSSAADENLQQHPGKNATGTGNCPLSGEYGLYSSNESFSESVSSKKQVTSSDNTSSDLKLLLEDLYLSECSSEDEYAKQSSMKKKTLRNKHISPVEYRSCSSADSNTSKSKSRRKCIKPSNLKDSHLKLGEEDLINPFTLLSLSNFFSSENVTSQQPILKEGKSNENNSAIFENALNLRPESSITIDDLSSINEMLEATNNVFSCKIQTTLSIVSSALNMVSSLSRQHSEECRAKTSTSLKPVTDTEAEPSNKKSESDSGTAGKDSLMSSRPRQHSKRKDKRKKKGRRK